MIIHIHQMPKYNIVLFCGPEQDLIGVNIYKETKDYRPCLVPDEAMWEFVEKMIDNEDGSFFYDYHDFEYETLFQIEKAIDLYLEKKPNN